ncbi:MAG: hypothetical protein ACLS85_07765 [Coprobacillus cateniformis]
MPYRIYILAYTTPRFHVLSVAIVMLIGLLQLSFINTSICKSIKSSYSIVTTHQIVLTILKNIWALEYIEHL